jgi:DNA-binding NarL/FixJ family response regulator
VLAAVARREYPGCSVTFAADLNEAYAIARSAETLDLVILDLGIPGCVGIEAFCRFHSLYPGVPVLIFSAFDDRETVLKAMRAGASGYVPKTARPATIAAAVRLVGSGQIYVPPVVIGEALARQARGAQQPLTVRERDVARFVARGLANKEIARELGIAENTVKTHLQSIYSHLGVSSRAQAVAAIAHHGLGFD